MKATLNLLWVLLSLLSALALAHVVGVAACSYVLARHVVGLNDLYVTPPLRSYE